MKVNISVLEVPLEFQGVSKDGKILDVDKFNNCKLRDSMFLTAEPLYKNIDIEFEKLIDIVNSDYRQYSPFLFKNGKKVSENWQNDSQNLIILDVDDGLSIDEAKQQFREYKYLIATTKSHQIDKKGIICDRFRIIIPANNIPKGEEYFKFTEILEKKYPFIDKQVNTKTGAFLGNFNCEYFYNDGTMFDCSPLMEAYQRMQRAKVVENKPKNTPTIQKVYHSEDLPIQDIKNRLTRETVADIVSSCGYEVNRQFKFKYRHDEKTPSASISPQLLIKDFGSELSTDIIGFIQEVKGVDFKTALEIVGGYVNVQIA